VNIPNKDEWQDPDEIVFLTVEELIEAHSDIIDFATPGEPKDILNYGRLEAAVMAPQQTFGGEYLYPSLYEMAAAYLYGLAMGHAFQQGNKRIAFAACVAFLKMNGLRLKMSHKDAAILTLQVVNHEIDRDDLVRVLREHTEPIEIENAV
jgi:death-on-curing protein